MSAFSINLWEQGFIPVRYSNKNLISHWYSTDSEENFKRSPNLNYTETSITYKFNSYGYRTKEFDLTLSNPRILCLGCSHTEGVGINENDTWVKQLEIKFPDTDIYNIGVSGSSCDTISRLLINMCSILKPNKVFILWPDFSRYETYSFKEISPEYPTINFNLVNDANRETMWRFDDIQTKANYDRNRAVILLLQEIYRFDLKELRIEDLFAKTEFTDLYKNSSARDNIHPSPAQHKYIAEKFLND